MTQNRTAIIMTLGMLLEKVDTSGFIDKMLNKAKEENAEFVFTQELQTKAFLLSETFNKGKVEPNIFENELKKLLGIQKLQSSEFWAEWDNIITIGNVAEKIQLLQTIGHRYNSLVYLATDINVVHLKKIAKDCEDKKIAFDITSQPMIFAQFPLYASCSVGVNRQGLTKHIVLDIQSKETNKPDAIMLILGNPENVKDKNHQAIAKKECDAISAWCKENNVSVKLHNNVLSETVEQIFSAQKTDTETKEFAVNM